MLALLRLVRHGSHVAPAGDQGPLQLIAQRPRHLRDDLRVPGDRPEETLAAGVEATRELGSDLGANERLRASVTEPITGRTQDEMKERRRGFIAEHVIQTLAEAERRPDDGRHRVEDHPSAPHLEESAMPDVIGGRPREEADARLFAHELTQRLSRSIPVDQEHETRAEVVQESLELLPAARLERPDALVEEAGSLELSCGA